MNKMEKMNEGKMPAEIGKLFGLLYDGESELLVRIASENLKKHRPSKMARIRRLTQKNHEYTDPLKP